MKVLSRRAAPDAYTKLLLNCEGVNNSTTFYDSCLTAKTVTVNGNAKISTSLSKFGAASGLFDGNGDSLKVVAAQAGTDFNLYDASAWTMDGWAYPTNLDANMHIYGYNNATANFWDFYIQQTTGKIVFRYNGNTASLTSSGGITAAQWNHWAIVYDGSNSKIYINGINNGSVASNVLTADGSYDLGIGYNIYGGGYDQWFNGNMGGIRISNGIVRWTTDFTPPTRRY